MASILNSTISSSSIMDLTRPDLQNSFSSSFSNSPKELSSTVPRHPIAAIQGAFDESYLESLELDTQLPSWLSSSENATSRRTHLLLDDTYHGYYYSSQWRDNPARKYHPLTKLIAQITFGFHLLHEKLAQSSAEVIRIIRLHAAEVDRYLDVVHEDFDEALTDIKERISNFHQALSYYHLIPDPSAYIPSCNSITDCPLRLRKITEYTSLAVHDALSDVDYGIKAIYLMIHYVSRIRSESHGNMSQSVRTDIFRKSLGIFVGIERNWLSKFLDLNSKGSTLNNSLKDLEYLINSLPEFPRPVSQSISSLQSWNRQILSRESSPQLYSSTTSAHSGSLKSFPNVNKPLPTKPSLIGLKNPVDRYQGRTSFARETLHIWSSRRLPSLRTLKTSICDATDISLDSPENTSISFLFEKSLLEASSLDRSLSATAYTPTFPESKHQQRSSRKFSFQIDITSVRRSTIIQSKRWFRKLPRNRLKKLLEQMDGRARSLRRKSARLHKVSLTRFNPSSRNTFRSSRASNSTLPSRSPSTEPSSLVSLDTTEQSDFPCRIRPILSAPSSQSLATSDVRSTRSYISDSDKVNDINEVQELIMRTLSDLNLTFKTLAKPEYSDDNTSKPNIPISSSPTPPPLPPPPPVLTPVTIQTPIPRTSTSLPILERELPPLPISMSRTSSQNSVQSPNNYSAVPSDLAKFSASPSSGRADSHLDYLQQNHPRSGARSVISDKKLPPTLRIITHSNSSPTMANMNKATSTTAPSSPPLPPAPPPPPPHLPLPQPQNLRKITSSPGPLARFVLRKSTSPSVSYGHTLQFYPSITPPPISPSVYSFISDHSISS